MLSSYLGAMPQKKREEKYFFFIVKEKYWIIFYLAIFADFVHGSSGL